MMGMESFADADPMSHFSLVIKEKAEPEEVITDGAECRKCHKKTVIEEQIQLRSGDEGTNTIFRCTNRTCGNIVIKR